MENSPDLKVVDCPPEMSGSWSYLPYEEQQEVPRRELQLIRTVHALIIPVTDIITLVASVFIAYFLAGKLINSGYMDGILGSEIGVISSRALWSGLGAIPLWLMVFAYFGVYRREVRRLSISTFDELPQTLGALTVGAWVMFSFLVLTSQGNPSGRALWAFVALDWLLLLLMLPLGRAVVRISLSFHNPFRASTIVVGAGDVGKSLIGKLNRHKEYGLRVVGFLDTTTIEESKTDKKPADQVQLLGRPSELRSIIDHYGVSRIIIAFSKTPHPLILGVIHQCQEMKVDISIVPRFFEALSSNVEIEDVEGLPILSLPRYSRHGFFMRSTKRLLDLLVTTVIAVLFLPFLLLVAILIKLDSSGPVFFKQERMGKNHIHFSMYKFRSMLVEADSIRESLAGQNEVTGPIFKMKDDPRITRVGRIIRRLSIDELPQLINVFKGEMSLVGPRPLPIAEAEGCLGTADMRHLVKPGITGLWQILGRSDIPYEEMVQLDYLYVANWTLRWDIKIILRTVLAIVRKRGAY